ncbi:MAG: ROK family protein [Hyphomicrobiales bacterium]|nr:MAG: ROK family protein [Hyphomicrobiales bacterium]
MSVLERLRGGLVASCQPVDDGPMDRPEIVAAMARAAVAGGAAGLRIEGIDNLRAVRPVVDVPIVGIVKSDLPDSPVRITVRVEDALALAEAGADIISYDATSRPRPSSREDVLAAILSTGRLAMADCSTLDDARHALAGGAAVIGSTMSGYTAETEGLHDGPDFELLAALRALGSGFVMAEGRFNTPELAARAMAAGAHAVTVGSALTRLEHITGWFADAVRKGQQRLTGYALDLGGTKTAAARIEDGRIVERLQQPTDAAGGFWAQLDVLNGMLTALGHRHGDPVGVAVAGRIDTRGNWYAVNTDTLQSIQAAPLQSALRERLGRNVIVVNDADAAAVAESRLGAGRGAHNFAYITVSTGVGGGLVLGGRLVDSSTGLAGHVGFASSRLSQALCGSGRFGTVESVAAGRAIATAAGLPDARAVFDDARFEPIIDQSAAAVAALVGDLTAILGLDRVAIGGSVGLADGYLPRVLTHLHNEPALFQPEVVPAALGAESGLVGALQLALDTAVLPAPTSTSSPDRKI